MLRSYLPILFLLGISVLQAVGMVVMSHMASPTRPTPAKSSPYESGIVPLGNTRERFSVKFYLVATIFILFDVEVVFLYPWAVVYDELNLYGFLIMFLFLDLVLWGYFYIWKKGVLDWSETSEPGAKT